MKILVTGGAGYLGSVLTPSLLAEGHEVTVLDNFLFQQNSLMECCEHDRFRVIRGDVRNERVLKEGIKKARYHPLQFLRGLERHSFILHKIGKSKQTKTTFKSLIHETKGRQYLNLLCLKK